MDDEYEVLAQKIKTYLDDNNLGDLSVDELEEKYKFFMDRFAPEILEKMDGREARDRIFMHDGDRNNLCYLIESSPEYRGFCGGIRGGTSYKFSLFKRDNGKWTTGSSKKNKTLSEDESINLAISIRDAIVEGANYIQNSQLNSVEDYVNLGNTLNNIFRNCPVNPKNSWIHKYYSIIFPDFIPNCHQDKMKKDMIRKLHLEPLNNFWANDAQLYLLSKKSGIKFYSLFDEQIVGLFYNWENNMWTDNFDKRNLIGENLIKYWAFTPGVMANREELCYDNSVMAMGWNYLGDLSQYEDNFDDAVGDIIKRTEKLKVKPTSALRSLYGIYKDIKPGDIICMRRGLTSILAVGKVTEQSKYYYDETLDNSLEDPFYHLRDGINWFKLDDEYKLTGSKFLRDTLYEITDERIINVIRKFEVDIVSDEIPKKQNNNHLYNQNMIYFGAPGTGKSYTLNKDMEELISDDDNYERVTFHPDYSYAHFVGTYKPVSSENGISYEYVPGPFMRTLVKAYMNPDNDYLLVIEEINRANVAAVFGDVFQLLDRDSNNESRYPIETTEDMGGYLKKELNEDFDKIKIPSNMFIWATMNSADQGVFPMDTAFKRRWDFRYFGINQNEELVSNIKVELNGQLISWNELRKAINEELLTYRINEDKLLGPFFAFNEYLDSEIPLDEFKDTFKSKIVMYLFEDAARSKRNDLFSGVSKNTNLTYSEICDAFDKKGVGIFCDNIKEKFISGDE